MARANLIDSECCYHDNGSFISEPLTALGLQPRTYFLFNIAALEHTYL